MNDCVAFVGQQFLWGTVASADVYLAGEGASGILRSVNCRSNKLQHTNGLVLTVESTRTASKVFPANGILGDLESNRLTALPLEVILAIPVQARTHTLPISFALTVKAVRPLCYPSLSK